MALEYAYVYARVKDFSVWKRFDGKDDLGLGLKYLADRFQEDSPINFDDYNYKDYTMEETLKLSVERVAPVLGSDGILVGYFKAYESTSAYEPPREHFNVFFYFGKKIINKKFLNPNTVLNPYFGPKVHNVADWINRAELDLTQEEMDILEELHIVKEQVNGKTEYVDRVDDYWKTTDKSKRLYVRVGFENGKKYSYFCNFNVSVGDKVLVDGSMERMLGTVVEILQKQPTSFMAEMNTKYVRKVL